MRAIHRSINEDHDTMDIRMRRGMMPCECTRSSHSLPLDNRYHSSVKITRIASGDLLNPVGGVRAPVPRCALPWEVSNRYHTPLYQHRWITWNDPV